MRLDPHLARAIRSIATDVFGAEAVVRLFGSRVDESRRGGDIDLHIEADASKATFEHELQFRTALWRDLDEPQVDVVVMARGAEPRWIDRAALREGIVL